MSDLIYSLTINDSIYEMVDYDKPVWAKPSGSGVRVIPFGPENLIESALMIFCINELDFSNEFKHEVNLIVDEIHQSNTQGMLIQLDESRFNNLKFKMETEFELLQTNFKPRLNIISHFGDAPLNEVSNVIKSKFDCCLSLCQKC